MLSYFFSTPTAAAAVASHSLICLRQAVERKLSHNTRAAHPLYPFLIQQQSASACLINCVSARHHHQHQPLPPPPLLASSGHQADQGSSSVSGIVWQMHQARHHCTSSIFVESITQSCTKAGSVPLSTSTGPSTTAAMAHSRGIRVTWCCSAAVSTCLTS